MIIGFDGSRAFVKDRTGTENYSYQLLKAISKTDKTNSYLIYLRPGQIQEIKKENWPDNFKFTEINLPKFWTQIGLAWRTFTDSIDVLFVPSHTLPLIRKPDLKTVITVHDLGAEYLPSAHQLKQVLYLNLMTHYQLKTASKIIAVSQATKEDIVKKAGIGRGKIEVIYEGINEAILKAGKHDIDNNIVKSLGLEKNRYFFFVGTIQPRKNLDRVISAFHKFLENNSSKDGYKLVLAGQKGWKSGTIYALPEKLGIEKNVIFTGRISDSEMISLYKNATGFVFVSLFEGFGLPILEAFALGCPVITSNVSSMPEVAGNAAITVDPYNEREIAESMQNIAGNLKNRNTLIQKGYRRVREFSWERCADKTLEVLKKTL